MHTVNYSVIERQPIKIQNQNLFNTKIWSDPHQGKLKAGRLSRLSGSDSQLGIILPRATPVLAAPNLSYELSNRQAICLLEHLWEQGSFEIKYSIFSDMLFNFYLRFRISSRPLLPEPYEQR